MVILIWMTITLVLVYKTHATYRWLYIFFFYPTGSHDLVGCDDPLLMNQRLGSRSSNLCGCMSSQVSFLTHGPSSTRPDDDDRTPKRLINSRLCMIWVLERFHPFTHIEEDQVVFSESLSLETVSRDAAGWEWPVLGISLSFFVLFRWAIQKKPYQCGSDLVNQKNKTKREIHIEA